MRLVAPTIGGRAVAGRAVAGTRLRNASVANAVFGGAFASTPNTRWPAGVAGVAGARAPTAAAPNARDAGGAVLGI